MRVLSLFDGMSCGRIALEGLGKPVDKYYASEIDTKALKVSLANYPDIIQLGDVTNIQSFPKVDLLLGGSPCQDLSQATKDRQGLKGKKSSLFYEYLRALDQIQPKYFLFENVGSMKSQDKEIITQLLGVEPYNINSKDYTAQLRNRLYWTNIPQDNQMFKKDVLLKDVLTVGYTERDKARTLMAGDSRPLSTPVKMTHRYFNTGFTTLVFKNENHYNTVHNFWKEYLKGRNAKFIDALEIDFSPLKGVRYLNQVELERLQGVPEGYTKVLSRNHAAHVLGNGWTIPVVKGLLYGL